MGRPAAAQPIRKQQVLARRPNLSRLPELRRRGPAAATPESPECLELEDMDCDMPFRAGEAAALGEHQDMEY